MRQEKVYCKRCKHFYVTWDVNFPNGCKLFGAKSRQLPSLIVYQSTGKKCEYFSERAYKAK
ncbi:uracil-DNA glycosylase [Geosporobacter ferrireducens]|uniref:Uracil-DNA glycosylase n=1 Tax=Geosporobacter ferrireducens TaxID=1424294 RepID=A0A1D8GG99_9FIRM|nr:uracil-DNA glycosylase [Geosporobacter ferrireducens]AOT69897.1 uracil-DNA glycosylase [Geosporobacter ferrireducens]MTI54407.1 uracil-DNA glycosylase [Geosporobacter ferrireducens]